VESHQVEFRSRSGGRPRSFAKLKKVHTPEFIEIGDKSFEQV